MGIHYSHSGISLSGDKIFIEDKGIIVKDQQIITGPRIGVDYAGADALRPYRFRLDSNFTF
jgi:DNA-3-methyladenine glycosylase